MTLEDIDIQWTVVCRVSPREAIRNVLDRAERLGWTLEELAITDLDGSDLALDVQWPAETMGTAKYWKSSEKGRPHSLFWSIYSNGRICKITGGLYIKQYAHSSSEFDTACDQAIADLRQLFDGDDVLCIVLTLEDEEGIDVAPGIAGLYRPSLWKTVSKLPLEDLIVSASANWIEVRPKTIQGTVSCSPFFRTEETTSAVRIIQSALETELWGTADRQPA